MDLFATLFAFSLLTKDELTSWSDGIRMKSLAGEIKSVTSVTEK